MESRVRLIILPASYGADVTCDRGYWYDIEGKQFGEILRANDDGIVTPGPTPGTNYLELRMYPYVKRTWVLVLTGTSQQSSPTL